MFFPNFQALKGTSVPKLQLFSTPAHSPKGSCEVLRTQSTSGTAVRQEPSCTGLQGSGQQASCTANTKKQKYSKTPRATQGLGEIKEEIPLKEVAFV